MTQSLRALLLITCLFGTIAVSGCGFLFVSAPPEAHARQAYVSCTESNVGPNLDFVWAGLNISGALAASLSPDSYVSPGETVAIGIAWTLFSGASGIRGLKKTSQCREAKRMLAERQVQQRGEATQSSIQTGSALSVTITAPRDTVKVGATLQLVAEGHGSSGAVVPGLGFTWSSSNDAIASVNASGLVTGHAAGSVVVAARTGAAVGTTSLIIVR